ncbi:transporter substrate-binding domain-containing protein [Occultella aeris]|uniref:ABC transporter arginine-binding protein 2 n=1 Tax=Occultella aeris TaxID=2761496 RepID=A0A7M4DM77_9MICO|nr:Putative ABC transporter arginine-binding protein 2 precursor [Occultella aeris]
MTITSRRKAAMFATAGAVALGLAACGGGGDAEGGGTDGGDTGGSSGEALTLEQLQEEGTITVGFAGEAPYSFEDGGELTGATVALHERIWNELGIENVEGVQAEFGQLIQGLNAGRFDVIAAGMSILPERCEQAIFSDPEFMYTTALMVPEGNPEGLTDMQSIVDSGVQVAALTGAIEATYATDLGISAMEVGNPQDGLDAVVNGRADVFALTGISLNWMADNNPDAPIEVTESFVANIDGVDQVGAGGTVFRPSDTDLRDAYNEQLAGIVGDEASYLEVVGDFGFTAEERPTGEITTEQFCAGDIG